MRVLLGGIARLWKLQKGPLDAAMRRMSWTGDVRLDPGNLGQGAGQTQVDV